MIGGEQSFGPGGTRARPVERLLPVDMTSGRSGSCPKGRWPSWFTPATPGGKLLGPAGDPAAPCRSSLPATTPGPLLRMGGRAGSSECGPSVPRQEMLALLRGFVPGDMPSWRHRPARSRRTLRDARVDQAHGGPVGRRPGHALQASSTRSVRSGSHLHGLLRGIITSRVPRADADLARQGVGKSYFSGARRTSRDLHPRGDAGAEGALSEKRFQPFLAAQGCGLGCRPRGPSPLDGYVLTTPKALATVHIVRPRGGRSLRRPGPGELGVRPRALDGVHLGRRVADGARTGLPGAASSVSGPSACAGSRRARGGRAFG